MLTITRCQKQVLDDDYCDCPATNHDEKKTSACSYYIAMDMNKQNIGGQRRTAAGGPRSEAPPTADGGDQFLCVGSGILKLTIPYSRVADGNTLII